MGLEFQREDQWYHTESGTLSFTFELHVKFSVQEKVDYILPLLIWGMLMYEIFGSTEITYAEGLPWLLIAFIMGKQGLLDKFAK